LVDEASQLYAAGGYANISFSTVAERTGLTKATVFHHFPNTAALLRAVFESFGERLERAAENWFDAPPRSHVARLEHVVESLVEFYGRDPLNARILCHGLLEAERLGTWNETSALTPPVFDHFVRRFVGFIAAGVAAGEFYPDRPMATIMAIGGIILFEFMLPQQGQQYRAGSAGTVDLAERGREMATVINRAVVRPGERLRRRRRGAAKGGK
jgi:AcrR family transcriptional regulator